MLCHEIYTSWKHFFSQNSLHLCTQCVYMQNLCILSRSTRALSVLLLLLWKSPGLSFSRYNDHTALDCLVPSLSKLILFAAFIIIFLNLPDTLLELICHFLWKWRIKDKQGAPNLILWPRERAHTHTHARTEICLSQTDIKSKIVESLLWAHLPCMYDNEWLSQQNKPRAAGEFKDQRLKWTSRSREIPHPRRVSSILFWYLFKTAVSVCNNRVRQHSLPPAVCFRFIECLWEREEINMFAAVRALSSLWLTRQKKMHNTSFAHCYHSEKNIF